MLFEIANIHRFPFSGSAECDGCTYEAHDDFTNFCMYKKYFRSLSLHEQSQITEPILKNLSKRTRQSTYYTCAYLRAQLILWLLMSTYQSRNFRPTMKNKEIHLRYLEEYMSYSSAMYGASMYLYDGKCSFKSCFDLASKASFCTSCCCCSKCSSQGKVMKFAEGF